MKINSMLIKKTVGFLGAVLLCIIISQKSHAQIKPVFNHVAICVKDLKVTVPFYSNVIGLPKIPNPFSDTVHQWFSLGPNIQLHAIQANCPTIVHDSNIHLSLSVPLLDPYMKHLDQLGIKYGDGSGAHHPQKRADGVLQIYLQDPDGYWIEINDAK